MTTIGIPKQNRFFQTSLPYYGQSKSALAFFNERIVSSLSIFSAPEDTISGATPTFMFCSFAI